MKIQTLLGAIGSTGASTFNELCRALDDSGALPEKGDKPAWRDLFRMIDDCERQGWIETDRINGKINTMILTPDGTQELWRLLS